MGRDDTLRAVPPGEGVGLRPLRHDDTTVLAEATRLNVNWAGEALVTDADVATDPALSHYTAVRPDRGDFGVVAQIGDRPVGVVWLLFLDAADPGYGYVADTVPELSVCVWPGHRGAGLGRLLVEAALSASRDRGLGRISLSVETGNPARGLYESVGFVDVPGSAAGTMMIDLG